MPAAASSYRPEGLIARLSANDGETKLKALRDLKNQIIGNRTKKQTYLKHGAVPPVVAALSSCDASCREHAGESLLIQSAAVLGSFSRCIDSGAQAVLDAGAFPHLWSLISHANRKVVDASAGALRMLYQSKLAPKYNFWETKNMMLLLSLLDSENENLVGLGLSVIEYSCSTFLEQKALCDAGVLEKLVSFFEGTVNQRDACLESLAVIFKNNTEVISSFMQVRNGRAFSTLIEFTWDRYPRTRLLACMCLINVKNTSPCYLYNIGVKIKLVRSLLELLHDPSSIGDQASFTLCGLIHEAEDMQKIAFEAAGVDKLVKILQEDLSEAKYLEVLRILAQLCSSLECCRSKFLSLQALNLVADPLGNDRAEVRIAACIILRNVFRSVKNLSAGVLMNEIVLIPLVQLLVDPCTSVQIAALGAISNIIINFTSHKSVFMRCGGVKLLCQLSKSMDSTIRLNAVWALRNLTFFADDKCKASTLLELTPFALASLICDPEPSVQEHALALVQNLVDGCIKCVEYAFAEDGVILQAVGRQLCIASKPEIGIEGMYVLNNVATGNEFHKEAVTQRILGEGGKCFPSFILRFLQSSESQLRLAAVWTVLNLMCSSSPGVAARVTLLQDAGILSQIQNMVEDPYLEVKIRAKAVVGRWKHVE